MVYSNIPAPPDDGYWEALLSQGEVSSRIPPPQSIEPDWNVSPQKAAPPPPLPGKPEDWERAEEDMRQHRILELTISGCNKGGVLVDYYSLQGFVPTSHMLNLPRLPDIEERLHVLSTKIGQRLKLRIIEIDRNRGRLILSERAALEDENALRLWETLKPGDILDGKVTRLAPYGAFVDIGGVEGLIHISELSWNRVERPGEVVHPGDHVRVLVLGLKPNQRKIALSIKRLQSDPWERVEERYHPGDIVEGVVSHIVNFGAFVRLEDGVEGLIHLSELGDQPFVRPWDVVRRGQHVRVKVLDVNAQNRRIALSLRQVTEAQ